MRFTGSEVHVYPVGVLKVMLGIGRSIRARDRRALGFALAKVRAEFRYLLGRVRERNWRAFRNAFNGYLAEDEELPRAGHGWTKKRALRDLERVLLTAYWSRHVCGAVRLRAKGADYCMKCDIRDRDGWTVLKEAAE